LLHRWLAPHADRAYALLRIVSGALFAFHGMQKIFGVLSASRPPLFSQVWVGGIIELVAGTLIAVGYQTTWAAFISSGQMAVAYTQFHWKLAFGRNFFPAVNKGELALVYAFVFLYVACKGSGRFSLDRGRG
jgi:putative oxidoreductase